MDAATNRVPASTAALVGLAAAGLYLLTLSRWHSWDSLLTAQAVQTADWPVLLDAHHFFLHPLAWAYWHIWRLAGWSGSTLVALQTLDVGGAALAVGVTTHLAHRITGSRRLAALVGWGSAVSGGMWMYATQSELVMLPLGLAMLVLAGALRSGSAAQAAGRAFGMGIFSGVVIATYLTNLALIPAIGLALWRGEAKLWRVAMWRYGSGLLLVLSALGISVALVKIQLPGWRLLPVSSPTLSSYVAFGWSDIAHGGYAFLRALVLYPMIGINDSTAALLAEGSASLRFQFVSRYAVMLAVAVAPVAVLLRHRSRGESGSRLGMSTTTARILAVVALWAAPCAVFAVWWVVGEVEFWLPTVPAWWLITAAALAQREQSRAVRIAAITVALIGVANATAVVLPQHNAIQIREPLYESVPGRADLRVSSPEQR